MALLDIRVLGDPILRRVTSPVVQSTPALRKLVDQMFETMHAAKGIGLAAPQVGRTERLAVVEVEDQALVLINPEILTADGSSRREEGCLSIPDVYAEVTRPAVIRVRAFDANLTPFEVVATDLLATCLQHEIDHLDGKLFLDKLSVLKKRSAMKQWEEIKGDYPNFLRTLTKADLDAHPNDEGL